MFISGMLFTSNLNENEEEELERFADEDGCQ
jgi:hypothetical protein